MNNQRTIYKYQTIKEILEKKLKFSHELINQVGDQNNVIIIQNTEYDIFDIYILYYFDWYPHVQVIHESSLNLYTNHTFFISSIEKIKKTNIDGKWDIFYDHAKANLNFDDFIIQFILKNPIITGSIKTKFITKKNQEIFNCQNCYFNKKIKIKDYLICKYYFKKALQNFMSDFDYKNSENICGSFQVDILEKKNERFHI
jgi:hypothetical protein